MGRRTLAIIVAVVLAVAAAALVWWYVASVKEEAKTEEVVQRVLVAREDIPALTLGETAVAKSLVETQEVPQRYVASGAVSTAAQVQGKIFVGPVTKGQQITSSQLGEPEAQSLGFKVRNGMRAVSIPIDRVRAVGGAIQTGDRIDIVVTFETDVLNETGKENVATVTRTLLQQVEVLDTDRLEAGLGAGAQESSDDQKTTNEPVVIVMVTPADAEKLVFVEEKGKVWFTLVPAEDTKKAASDGHTIQNVFE